MASTRASGRRRPETLPLSEADRELLAYLAEHRLARVDHVGVFLGLSTDLAAERVDALGAAGYLGTAGVYAGHPATVQITRRGLAAILSDLPTPRLDLRAYAHDVGVAWLWLAARSGAFGELSEVIGERRLRSRDGPGRRSDPPLAVRLGGLGAHGEERLHYPDLLLVTTSGRRIALELELTAKGRARRERILAGFSADPHLDAVLYLVADPRVGRAIAGSARQLGASERIMVQRIAMAEPTEAPEVGRVARRAGAGRPDRRAGPEGILGRAAAARAAEGGR